MKARNKKMSMAALIPGLAIKVEGYYLDSRLIAQTVRFKGNDLKQAETIEAGMHETKVQVQQNEEELEKQKAELEAQRQALQQQEAKVAANKVAIDAAVARFGQLDDYYILDEVTVYFGQRQGQSGSKIHFSTDGTSGEGQDNQWLHGRSKGLRLLYR